MKRRKSKTSARQAPSARVQQVGKPTRRNKFNNRKVKIGTVVLDSLKEARRYRVLQHELKTGDIDELLVKPKYALEVNGYKICDYIPDFVYRRAGLQIVEDVKGFRTPEYRLKRKLMRAVYGVEIVET